MNTAEILQAKDLRIQVLEEQLTACKSDRKRLKKQLKLHIVSQQRELLIDAISNMTRGDFELRSTSEYVDDYLESINCG